LRKCLTNFLKILNVNSEYSNSWIVDQIRWMKYNYKKLSSNIKQRKHEIMRIINIIIQNKIITDEKETIIKVELKTYFYSQAT
jgi:predicted nucleic-acid-binding protein